MLILKDIYKSFPGLASSTLSSINLRLSEGEFCVLVGGNGSGKSTLMKVISGVMKPDKGKIIIDGDEEMGNNAQSVASVVQDIELGVVSQMTFLENLTLSKMRAQNTGFKFYSRYREEFVEQIQKLGLGLVEYIDKPVSCLSGGQKQMVALVMAIFSRPKIILLDEHTSALDHDMQCQVMDYTIRSIITNNLTGLMVTHNLADAIKYGDRLIMLSGGKIVLDLKGEDKTSLSLSDLFAVFHSNNTNIGGNVCV